MDNLSLDKARLSDSLRISILLKTVYIQAYAIEGITFEFANFIEEKFSKEKIEEKIKENPDNLLVCHCNGNPIGIAEIIYNSECPIRKIATPELGKLYVLERFHRTGVAGHLMQKVEEITRLKGYKELNLEVWENNLKAIKFYEKHGYKLLGKVDFPMETNTYVNLVMNKVFK
ncbi:GNAT family N-acetyltransferase [Muricauda sp. JGD-17]|uniref:GNAT family N-acetyltransferase n=1 Tax=Flagellimonas ochracea TaxID=2696472 RepID=A0A964TD26_9FLAO|nr:GNAT family N-acetyltransferase [Allomuricauda ochracea]NAY92009.1 GNAT family N-acetyltransferase [Allomuricauda ochracea]